MRQRDGAGTAGGQSGSVADMSVQESDADISQNDTIGGAPRWLIVTASLVLVVGLTLFGVFGVKYYQARAAQNVAAARDTVSDVASQVIINAFSFDHRSVDESLGNLAGVSTGDFLAEQEQWSGDVRSRVLDQKAVTTATVSNTAVESLDMNAGQAAVLVVFTAHSEREGQDPITGRQAMRVDLVREGDSWKASAVNQVGVTVPVGESSRSVQELEGVTSEQGSGEPGSASGTATPAPTTSAGR